MKHTYTYVQGVRTKRGFVDILRRDDGKRVKVTRKRLNQLGDEGRLHLRQSETTAKAPSK